MSPLYCCPAGQSTRGKRYGERVTKYKKTEGLGYISESTITSLSTEVCPAARTSKRYSAQATYIFCSVCLKHADTDYKTFRTRKLARAFDVTESLSI